MFSTVGPMVLPALQAVVYPDSNPTVANTVQPTSDFTLKALNGDFGSWFLVAGSIMLRAGIIAVGLWAIDPNDKEIVKRSFAASAAVEVFVLAWTLAKVHQGISASIVTTSGPSI